MTVFVKVGRQLVCLDAGEKDESDNLEAVAQWAFVITCLIATLLISVGVLFV